MKAGAGDIGEATNLAHLRPGTAKFEGRTAGGNTAGGLNLTDKNLDEVLAFINGKSDGDNKGAAVKGKKGKGGKKQNK